MSTQPCRTAYRVGALDDTLPVILSQVKKLTPSAEVARNMEPNFFEHKDFISWIPLLETAAKYI